MTAITQQPGYRDIFQRLGRDMYAKAYGKGMSLSAYLEREVDPSSNYDKKDPEGQLDAFGRLMMAAGIVTRSMPEFGLWASKGESFFQNEQTRALFPEFMARVWRRTSYGTRYSHPGQQNRSTLYDLADGAPGSWLNPYFDAAQARWSENIAPAIPLSEVVAITTPITGNTYRAFYLTHTASKVRMVRVGSGADLPESKLASSEHTIPVYKYGRQLKATYEDLRNMRVDRIALHIAQLAIQAETDKVATALDVMVNGDGNSGTAATNYALNTLDAAAVSGTLTLKGWLAFKMKFANPYTITGALTREAVALQMMMLNTGSANVPLVQVAMPSGFGYFSPINPGLADNTRLGWTSDAPANVIVGFDRRMAIERVVEIGGDISEVDKVIGNQTQIFTMSEVEGYAVFDANAAKTLTLTF